MAELVFLVFGDLHGRILPAFRLATAWGREHGAGVTGILQVGDLGYFPDPSRLDEATRRHAAADPLELGTQLVAQPSVEADQVFAETETPQALWFTAGNHEDFEALKAQAHGDVFAVDAYRRVWCIRDGHVVTLAGGLRVGALWGIDSRAPVRRRNVPLRAQIDADHATRLACLSFDVLLTHDSPRDAIVPGAGSEEILELIRSAQPAFAFFGHHQGRGRRIEGDFGRTEVYHLSGMELRASNQYPEEGSVGALCWDGTQGRFTYLDSAWLRTFSRHNWRYR
jgi:hypothetical protein